MTKRPKHPYAAIEHRVLDSEAYADLTHSARSVLMAICRQLTKDNNGHLQATAKYMNQYGISENTTYRAINELIAHGFIYRTSLHKINPHTNDYKRIPSKYAVTWLPIVKKEGLYLFNYESCAWRHWSNKNKKPTLKKNSYHPQTCGYNMNIPPIFDANPPL